MPRIDPFQLLKCLSVLLEPTGGIKSKQEVHRLADLMTKFSKKLVSKCIYIQILKTTNTELLSQFMDAGGWSLVHMWLTDGIVAKNWALIQELLELLHLCPVKIERLKSNNCPKLIKGLSKEVSHQGVRLLASRLVEQWLKIVKGEAAPNSVPAQIIGNSQALNPCVQTEHYTITSGGNNTTIEASTGETAPKKVQDIETTTNNYTIETTNQPKPMQLHVLNSPAVPVSQSQQQQQQQQPQQQQQVQHITQQSYVVVGNGTSVVPSGPVCKITIRDGNHVLVKVETDAANINNAMNQSHETNGELVDNDETTEQNDADYDEMTIERLDDEEYDGTIEESTNEVKQQSQIVGSAKNLDNHQISTRNKEAKENSSGAIVDIGKTSDKENRDSHKIDEKKMSIVGENVGTEKKSGSSSSKSGSSSKHSSSSHRTSSSSSSSHRSSHRSSSSSNSSSTKSSSSKSSRDKERHHHHSSSSKHASSSSSSSSTNKNRTERDKERDKEKEKLKKDQADKDKATLEKVQAQAISSKLGKIPKKKPEDEKQPAGSSESLLRKSSTDSKDSSKENKDKIETRRNIVGNSTVLEKKNISISIENRKNSLDSARPKTVKTFNSKFRSTGLEEEVKPPPPRSAAKKSAVNILDKKIVPPKPLTSLKRTSPLRDTSVPSDKRAKLSLDPPAEPVEEKKGSIKLISPKPKPMVLQESDMFMDALMTASTKSKEPRKKNKRRTSISKDGGSDSKKSDLMNSDGGHDSPSHHPSSPPSSDDRSPLALKPNFKFYQDTLETDEDKEEKEEQLKKLKEEESEEMKLDPDGIEDYETNVSNLVKTEMAALAVKAEAKEAETEVLDEVKSADSLEREDTLGDAMDFGKKERSLSPQPEIRYVDGLRSILLLQKRKGPKKSLKWKPELESIRLFELDETERVNVTKTFTDMKQMEKLNEREAFQMARKLSNEDLMEEKTIWKPLIPIDLMAPLVEPGKESREKGIQYAREKGILQALYFNRSMIPDSPAEPDEERHHAMTDPKIIPLEDLTGNKDSEKDFTNVAWPEPKPSLPPPAPVMQAPGYHFPPGYPPHGQPPMMPQMGPPGPMGPMPPMPPGPMMGPMNHMGPPDMGGGPMVGPPGGGGGGWRTGDGKVVVPDVGMNPMQQPMPNMPGNFPPGMDGSMGPPPGMMGPPMFNQQEGFGMMGPDEMGYGNFQGPPGPPGPPGMFGPGPNFGPGGPPRGGGPMHGNRGRGNGPGWFRGGAGGPMGPRMGGGGGGWRGGWRGNGKQPPICRQFTKNGFCRVGDKCQYLHPGVNCPPF